MRRIALIGLMLLFAAGAVADTTTCGTTVQEQTSGELEILICDGSGTQAAACTAAGLTGSVMDPNDITQIKYKTVDAGTKCVAVAETTILAAAITANPHTITVLPAHAKIFGWCSTTDTTCCAQDSDCPAGETCKLPRSTNTDGETFKQTRKVTYVGYWTGGGQAVGWTEYCVEDSPDFPF